MIQLFLSWIHFPVGGVSLNTNIHFLMTTILCVSKTGAPDVNVYDHALIFSVLQEKSSLKQTETPNS